MIAKVGNRKNPAYILLLAFFLALAVINAVKAARAIPSASDTTHPESAVIEIARWAAQSHRIYPPLSTPPYTPALYGPLFNLGLAVAGRSLGGNVYRIRVVLRCIAFLCYLLTGLVVYGLARRIGAPGYAALLAAAISWGAPFILYWNVSARPDFPALLPSLLGLWTISGGDAPVPKRGILAGVLCAAATLVKQSLVAAPMAIVVFLVLRRSYRSCVAFVISYATAAALVIGFLLLRGEPVITQMLLVSHLPVAVRPAFSILSSNLARGLGLLVVAGGLAGFLSAFGSHRPWALLISIYAIFAVAIAFVSLLQVGSSANYLLEPWTAAAILAACALAEVAPAWPAMGLPLRVGAVAVVILLGGHTLHRVAGQYRVVYNYDRLRGLRVLSTNPSFAIHGRKPELLDTFLSAVLEKESLWSSSGITRAISRKKFDVAFLDETDGHVADWHGQPLLGPEILEALDASYRPLCETPHVLVLVPTGRLDRFSLADASYTLRQTCHPLQ